MSHSSDVRIWFTASTGERYEVGATGPDYYLAAFGAATPPVGTEGVLWMTVDGRPHSCRLRVVDVKGEKVRTEGI